MKILAEVPMTEIDILSGEQNELMPCLVNAGGIHVPRHIFVNKGEDEELLRLREQSLSFLFSVDDPVLN